MVAWTGHSCRMAVGCRLASLGCVCAVYGEGVVRSTLRGFFRGSGDITFPQCLAAVPVRL